MISTLFAVILTGLAIAISPLRISAVTLVLISPGRRGRGVLFLIGYVVAITIVTFGALILAGQLESQDLELDETSAVVLIVIGLGLISIATWQMRQRHSGETAMPKWMTLIGDLGLPTSFLLGAGFSVLSFKNLSLTAAAVLAISAADLSNFVSALMAIVFIAIASLGVAMPVVLSWIGGNTAGGDLDRIKNWLVAHNALVVGGGLLVFGFLLVAKGLSFWWD